MDKSLHPSLLDRLRLLFQAPLQDLPCRIARGPIANEDGYRQPAVGHVLLTGVEELLNHIFELEIFHDLLLEFLQELFHRFFIGGELLHWLSINPKQLYLHGK